MRTKVLETMYDSVDLKKPKRTQRVKKVGEGNKLIDLSEQKEVSQFVDHMAKTLKEFEKMEDRKSVV